MSVDKPRGHYEAVNGLRHRLIRATKQEVAVWQSVVLGFLTGIVFGNGIPHFVKGITKERYPSMLGNGPVPNLIAGWISFVIVGVLTQWIDLRNFCAAALTAAALGVLLIGLFHAGIGAFGRADQLPTSYRSRSKILT
jgi:hypothetical protein